MGYNIESILSNQTKGNSSPTTKKLSNHNILMRQKSQKLLQSKKGRLDIADPKPFTMFFECESPTRVGGFQIRDEVKMNNNLNTPKKSPDSDSSSG